MAPPSRSSTNGPDVDNLLQTLSNPIRRETIRYFENHPVETSSIEDLVAHLETQHPSKAGDELWRTLYQVHLPNLESDGWLAFDSGRETVSYHGQEDAMELLREVCAIFEE